MTIDITKPSSPVTANGQLKISEKEILRTLERSDRLVLAVVPGIGADRLMGKKMYLTGSPVDLPTLLPSAELLLTNGGNHVVGLAIAAGIPLVCIPMQPEQALTALRVATGGFGEYWFSDLHEVGRLANFMQPPRSVGN
jgi:UDP:flavonoid glycosyltransferase YjiC (YdhE family)